jgi:hypothetical protein
MRTTFSLAVALAVGLGSSSSGPRYSDWSTPTYAGSINTVDLEFPNGISRDGLSLYFQRGNSLTSEEA